MSDNGWPGKLGVPLNPERNGWHWVQRLAKNEKPRVEEWTGSGWWTCPKFGGPQNNLTDWRYLGPCLTPAEVEARVKQARRDALEEAAREIKQRGEFWSQGSNHDAKIRADECQKIEAAIRVLEGEGDD
jgi:hypothetical protein